jgi:putative membrane protein
MMNAELATVVGQIRPGFFFLGFLLPLIVIALAVYGIWELYRSRSTAPVAAAAAGATSARVVLDERFARGEIDAEEYVQRRTLLDGSPVATPAGPATEPPTAQAPVPDVSPDVAPTGEQPVVADAGQDPSPGPSAG